MYSIDDIKKKSIILIGPLCSGKTTISDELLRRRPELELVTLDESRLESLKKFGYHQFTAKELYFRNKYDEYMRYSLKYNFKLVESVLTNLERPSLIEFGAGDTLTSSKEDEALLEKLMEEFENVVLILPSSNPTESIEILKSRAEKTREEHNFDYGSFLDMMQWRMINGKEDESLATIVVYTKDKTPKETTEEILQLMEEKKQKMK